MEAGEQPVTVEPVAEVDEGGAGQRQAFPELRPQLAAIPLVAAITPLPGEGPLSRRRKLARLGN